MIEVTTLHDEVIMLNADQILQIQHLGDTLITFNNGNKIRVKESAQEIADKMMKWHQSKWIPFIHE